jgi:hypothetical protein
MLLLLGIFGLIQAVYLPGALCLQILKFKNTKTVYLILSFGLSLALNSNMVFLLSYFNLYNQKISIVIFIIEIIIFIFYVFKNTTKFCFNCYNINKIKFQNKINKKTKNIIKISIFILFIGTFVGKSGLSSLGEVFTFADSVASWNRWAVDLAVGYMPRQTYGYPQLLPSILSIPYVFMNDTCRIFFHMLFALFFLLL